MSSLELAINFYNKLFENIGEETISMDYFKKIFNHRIGFKAVDENEYNSFVEKLKRAYSHA